MKMVARPIGRVLVTLAMWSLAGAAVSACPICFQAEDAQAASGIRVGMGVMVGVTAVVLAGFGRFAIRIARNQK